MNDDTEAVNLIDLLDRLIEIQEPAPVSWLPQTWGWAVLAAIAIALIGWFSWQRLRRFRANAYRRAALAELEAAGDNPVLIASIVRRTALAAYPRATVAALTGQDWLEFLDARANGVRFDEEPGCDLVAAAYNGRGNAPGLNAVAREWVRRHRVPCA